jgi:hypothetical protein
VGFLWGSAAVSLSCRVSVGSPKPLTGPADPTTGDFRILMTTVRVGQRHRSGFATYYNSTSSLPTLRLSMAGLS